MAIDLVQIRKLAETREDENYNFRRFLKTECDLETDEIDQRVFEITRRVARLRLVLSFAPWTNVLAQSSGS